MRTMAIALFVLISALASTAGGEKKIVVPIDARSIRAALDKADTGDTVFVRKGLYRETIILKEGVVLIGESARETIIKGNGSAPVVKAVDRSHIKNFTIENGGKGISCENTATTIEQCIIRNNRGSGIHCLISLPVIRNCAIHSNDWAGIYCESVRSIKTAIEHNVIGENGYCGIMLSGNSEVLVESNVLIANKQFGIWVGEDSKRSRIVYNNFYTNRTSHNFFAQIDRSNISEDPRYPAMPSGSFDYYGFESLPMKGKGRDGATIGLISDAEMTLMVNDTDGDGVTNENDKCPTIAEDLDGFEDDDGCPDFDNDKDGIFDTQDRCPNDPEDFDGFMDDDGCPDLDNDKDGIPDKDDLCPMNAEVFNGYKDEDGCPDEVPSSEQKTRQPSPKVEKPASPKNDISGKAAVARPKPLMADSAQASPPSGPAATKPAATQPSATEAQKPDTNAAKQTPVKLIDK